MAAGTGVLISTRKYSKKQFKSEITVTKDLFRFLPNVIRVVSKVGIFADGWIGGTWGMQLQLGWNNSTQFYNAIETYLQNCKTSNYCSLSQQSIESK